MERAQRGDRLAFEALVERHRDRVFALALRMLNSPEEAAVVTQEAFLAAYRQLGELGTDAHFGSFARKTAAIRGLAKLGHRPARTLGPVGGQPEGRASGLRRAVEQATAALEDEPRVVLVLRELNGASYQEIAELTRSSVETVRGRLHRARLAIQAAIAPFRRAGADGRAPSGGPPRASPVGSTR